MANWFFSYQKQCRLEGTQSLEGMVVYLLVRLYDDVPKYLPSYVLINDRRWSLLSTLLYLIRRSTGCSEREHMDKLT